MNFTLILTAIKAIGKYWKYALIAVFALISACTAAYALQKSSQVEDLQLENKYAQTQLQKQSDTITKLTSLQEKVSEQMIYRETARKAFNDEANRILGKLDELKKDHKKYALCSGTELPYKLDSLFSEPSDSEDGVSGSDASGSLHESHSKTYTSSSQQSGQEYFRRLRTISN